MKLLADYHHSDLFESHQLVFGDRFGWDVYAPYGMDWFDEWFWNFERNRIDGKAEDAVARQFLLGIWGDAKPDTNGIVRTEDPHHPGRTLRGITLQAARDQRWDVVMSTVPQNARGFRRLARENVARFAIHVGNQWGDEAWAESPDFAIVTTTSAIPNVPHVVVHQEFSLRDFRYEEPDGFGPIRSFVNCFQETPEYPTFQSIARSAPDFPWEVYGALGMAQADEFAAGDCSTTPEVALRMRESGAIWHAKHWSDGFGHVVHNAFAVGRPVFGYARYYTGGGGYEAKLAGPLWVDGVTSIDVERHDAIDELRRLRNDRDAYLRMCEAAAARFREIVSFEDDARKIADLVGLAVVA